MDQSRVSDAREISGHGVKVKIDGKMVLAGNGKLMDEEGISYTECDSIGTVVYEMCIRDSLSRIRKELWCKGSCLYCN